MDNICFRKWDSGTGEGRGLRPLAVLLSLILVVGLGGGIPCPLLAFVGIAGTQSTDLQAEKNTHRHKVKDKQTKEIEVLEKHSKSRCAEAPRKVLQFSAVPVQKWLLSLS